MLSADDVIELLAIELIGIVPEDENVVISTNKGQPVALDGKTRAGEAYHNIARRLNGEKVPFMNLDEKEGIFHKLARMIRPGGN